MIENKGYTKIIQAGQSIEIYNYKKKFNVHRKKRIYSKNKRKKKKNDDSKYHFEFRSSRSIQRARQSLFRLVETNLYTLKEPVFITLTCFQNVPLRIGYKQLKYFWQNVKKRSKNITYIAVPEWQQRGALHYHCIVWGLNRSDVLSERKHRFYQRCWARGYVDVRIAKNNSLAIAGYMAKYLTKALQNPLLANNRAYSCSRNINRPTTYGSNSIVDTLDVIIPNNRLLVKTKEYSTVYLGQCNYIKYKILNYDET